MKNRGSSSEKFILPKFTMELGIAPILNFFLVTTYGYAVVSFLTCMVEELECLQSDFQLYLEKRLWFISQLHLKISEGIHALYQCADEFIRIISIKGKEDGPFGESGKHHSFMHCTLLHKHGR